MKSVGKVKFQGSNEYKIFESIRKSKGGGGLATGISKHLEPVYIREGDDFTELLVTQIKIRDFYVRLINAYGPQECDSLERKEQFWGRIAAEIRDAEDNNCGIFIEMDSNAHLGLIENDPCDRNHNGTLFAKFLGEHPSLHLLNNDPKCEGLITRKRIKG